MTTFSNLQTRVSREIKDTGQTTFPAQDVADMLNDAFAEVSRLAPKRFRESVAVVADTLSYALAAGTSPEMEVKRVEVWDISTTPDKQIWRIQPSVGEYVNDSQTGWEYWDGLLYIPNTVEAHLVPGTHELRVWGYAPWVTQDLPDGSGTDIGMSNELEKAALSYCQVEAFTRLRHDRALFGQWAGADHNTDVSLAGLISALNVAQDDWRRRSRQLAVIREAP